MERKAVTSMPGTPSRPYVVRHGKTAWSLSGQHTGRTDIAARRTCELAGLNEVAQIEPDLAEWDYGGYEGQRPADIREARPDWNVCRDGSTRGESPAQVFRTQTG